MTEGRLSDFTASMMAAFSNCTMYSEEHPIVSEFSEKAYGLLKDLYVDGSLSITLLGDSLVFNNSPIAEKGIHFDNFAKRLRRKGIEKIEIRRGVTIKEFKNFIASMSSKEIFFTSQHISLGIVEVESNSDRFSLRTLVEENISKIKDVYQGISYDTPLDIKGLEDAVVGLISTLKREANVLSILSPVKTYNEYTYVHAANVSALTIFQAETLGMSEENICDIGLAGLLHDVGKIFVPIEMLDKHTKLDLNEWNLMRLHPVHGARYLSTLPEIPKLALIVAFEHHIKFDGSGYPDTRQGGKKQNPISQMVAISDVFDALRTERPYRKPVEVSYILNLLKEGAGKDFNPFLVDNFISSLDKNNAV